MLLTFICRFCYQGQFMKVQMGAGSILDFCSDVDIDTGQRISDDIILIFSSQLSLKFTLISTSIFKARSSLCF